MGWLHVESGPSGTQPRAQSIQPKFPEISVQNSMDRFGQTGKVSKKTGPPFEVDHFSQTDRSKFWLNGSRPHFHCFAQVKHNSEEEVPCE